MSNRISYNYLTLGALHLNTSDICRFLSLVLRLFQKGFQSDRLGKFFMDLCHCVKSIESVMFREKVEVPIFIAKTLSEYITLCERANSIIGYVDPKEETTDPHEISKKQARLLARFYTKLARDYTMQTKIGMQCERLFFMDVCNSTPHQLLEFSIACGDIEGAGSNVFWLHANRNL